MLQARFAHSFEVAGKLLIADGVVMALGFERETIFVMNVIEYGEIDNHQFLVEVYLPALVHWMEIHGAIALQVGLRVGDGLGPVYLVVSAM